MLKHIQAEKPMCETSSQNSKGFKCNLYTLSKSDLIRIANFVLERKNSNLCTLDIKRAHLSSYSLVEKVRDLD